MIYLDHNATTPIAPDVRDAMRPYLESNFGNPSSAHVYGAAAADAVQRARAEIAALLGCEPDAIVFTGSGSEADNLAVVGVALAHLGEGDHLITSVVEHPAVIAASRYLERRHGYRVTRVPVDGFGVVDPDDVRRAIEPGTVLISVMRANNEVGTLQPIAEIARVARETGIPLHTDAAQAVDKLRTDVDELGVDLLTVVGHKMYAPKGIGALYVRPGTRIDPVIHGAGHEHGLRAGTETSRTFSSACGRSSASRRLTDDALPDRAHRLRPRVRAGEAAAANGASAPARTSAPHSRAGSACTSTPVDRRTRRRLGCGVWPATCAAWSCLALPRRRCAPAALLGR
jgi:cysteine desulfurase